MANLTLRQTGSVSSPGASVKGSPLTNLEVDNNFSNLNLSIGTVSDLNTIERANVVFAIRELQTGKANIASPSLTGTPQSITAVSGTSNAMIATTAFVQATVGGSSPGPAFNTANAAFATANVSSTTSNVAFAQANVAFAQANVAFNQANTAIAEANLKVGSLGGVTSATISNAVIASALTRQTITLPTIAGGVMSTMFEKANVRSEAPAAEVVFDILTDSVKFFTSNATANVAVHFRGNSTTTVNTALNTSQNTYTAVLVVTTGATPYYVNNVMIDGAVLHNATVRGNLFWQSNTLTAGGTAAGIDVYTFTLIRAGNAVQNLQYKILASQTPYKSFLS